MSKITSTEAVAALLLTLACVPGLARGIDFESPPTPPAEPLFPPVWLPDASVPSAAAGGHMRSAPPSTFDLDSPTDRPERGPRKVGGVTAGEWGSLTTNATIRDVDASMSWEDPVSRREWKTDGNWRLPVAGPLFVYGQFGGGGTQIEQQDTQVSGRTGVGCKWAPVQDAEFTVRAGPSVTYTDPLRIERVQERSEWLLEVQARWPVFGKIGLEYQATAAPALSPLDHDWMNTDLGLAMPVCAGGKVRFGARHKWENVPDQKPTPDSMQLYFGLELTH